MFKLFFYIFVISSSFLYAHVGSINTIAEDKAGPYQVRVIIQPTFAIPGFTQVDVRILQPQNANIHKVTLLPLKYNVKLEGQPPPEELNSVSNVPNLFSGCF